MGNTGAWDSFQQEGWNTFWFLDPEDIDKPSPLYDQLRWLGNAGSAEVDVHWTQAGHAVSRAWKPKIGGTSSAPA